MNWALHLIGDRWSLELIKAAFLGAHQFSEFMTHLDIPRQTLSLRLKKLVQLDILEMVPYQQRPVRLHYRLTTRGRALYPNVLMAWLWERKWSEASTRLPAHLVHKSCGKRFLPACVCASCRQPAHLADVNLKLASANGPAVPSARSHRLVAEADDGAKGLSIGVNVDRWALLIITAIMLGSHQFNQLQSGLQLGSSTLTNRLDRLIAAGLILRRPDLRDGRRFFYILSPPGLDLFHYLVTFSAWYRQDNGSGSDSIRAVHKGCGKRYRPLVICRECGEELRPEHVRFEWQSRKR